MQNRLTLAVAAYNVAPFLGECLESIRAQSVDAFELLVVDDGSTDETPALLADYAARWPKLTVVRQENAGISVVRNTQIERCGTEYLWMIDGDDCIAPDAVERLLPALDGVRDIVYFGFLPYGEPTARPLSHTLRDLTKEELACLRRKSVFDDPCPAIAGINANSAVMCAHRVEPLLRKGIRFEPGRKIAQDVLFNAMLLPVVEHAAYLDEALYRYRVNEGSTSLRWHPGLSEDVLEWLGKLAESVAAQGDPALAPLLSARIVSTARSTLQLELCHPYSPRPYAERRAAFAKLMANERLAAGVRACPPALLGRTDRLFLLLLRLRWFFALDLLSGLVMRRRYRRYRAHGGAKP